MEFTVDYARTLDEVFDDAGVTPRAAARLGVFGSGRHALTAELVVLAEDASTPRVLALLAERTLRPATAFELAAASLADRTLGTDGVVVALGSCDVNHVGGSACPAIAGFAQARPLVMTGFLRPWPAGTAFLAIPAALEAGLGKVAHNHLLPIEARRSPKLVFGQPPCAFTYAGVAYDGSIAPTVAAKRAKLRHDVLAEATTSVPVEGKHMLDVTVILPNRQIRPPEVVAMMAARGLRPATVLELIALVAAHPAVIDELQIWSVTDRAGVYKAIGRTIGIDHRDPDQPWPFSHAFAGVHA